MNNIKYDFKLKNIKCKRSLHHKYTNMKHTMYLCIRHQNKGSLVRCKTKSKSINPCQALRMNELKSSFEQFQIVKIDTLETVKIFNNWVVFYLL